MNKNLISILAICGLFLASCASTVTPTITDYKIPANVTAPELTQLSGVIATDKTTGVRTVTSSYVTAYKANWTKYHTIANVNSVVVTKLKNGNYTIDFSHFVDSVLLLHLSVNGINSTPIAK